MGESPVMANDRLTLITVVGGIGLFILISVAYAFIVEGWLGVYLSDESSPLAVVMFAVFLGGALYVEHRKERDREKEGNVHHWFSEETHEAWNSKDINGKVVVVLGYIIGAIVGLFLMWLVLMFVLGWFFSQA